MASLYADEDWTVSETDRADADEPPTDQEEPPKKKAKIVPKPKVRDDIMVARKAAGMDVDEAPPR